MSDFASALERLCTEEAMAARGDSDRQAAMIERLAHALGVSIGWASQGDGAVLDTLASGAEAFAHATAVEIAPLAKMVARARPAERRGE